MLIQHSAAWLKRKGYPLVITDMTHAGSETADAIGWNNKHSTLIECKASRSDFRSDASKSFRIKPDTGMGTFRYYCTPAGLLKPEELPEGWGLLEWDGRKMVELRKSGRFTQKPYGVRQEVSLLLSAIRRIGKTAPTGISVRCYTMETKNRATLGVVTEP